jgi:diadenosine tetraphosphate (Ap4A) HIT family hydrolase
VPENSPPLPDFTRWPSFPFEGDMRVKALAEPVEVEPPRSGEDAADCVACNTPDDAYIWVSDRWRVRAMDRPTGLPMVLILECRSHLDLGDLPNLLAAELGVMTVRLERAIRSLDGVARVHVNRWGDGSAHLHMWFLARPRGRLQLRGTFLSLWDDILPVIPEQQWRENLALVAAWLAEFGGHANAEPPHIQWLSPSRVSESPSAEADGEETDESLASTPTPWRPTDLADVQGEGSNSEIPSADVYAEGVPTQDLGDSSTRAGEPTSPEPTSPEPASLRSAIEANEPPPERFDVGQLGDSVASTAIAESVDSSAGDSARAASGDAADSGWPASQREPAGAEHDPNAAADAKTNDEPNEKMTWAAGDSAAQTSARP